MTHLGLVLFSFALSLVSSATTEIEQAFLRNDPNVLKSLLESGSFLNVSFSSPVAFSDLLSDEQTVFWFQKFFRSYRTLGFYPEGTAWQSLNGGSFVFKARWEVQTRDRRPVAFDVLFLIRGGPFRRDSLRVKANGSRPGQGFWTILQIRAERR